MNKNNWKERRITKWRRRKKREGDEDEKNEKQN